MDKKQAEMKQDIHQMMSKKDYYDILGINKQAVEADIKKAYRKLAVKYHPDKNSAEGAKDVFKKVTNAYSVLVNAQQRERYDRYGPEQEIQARQRQQYRQNYQGDRQFDQFDQIFKAFFGMNNMQMHRQGGGHRTYTYQFGSNMGARAGNGQPRQQNQNQGFGLGYLFLIMFIFYAVAPLFRSKPYYSFNVSSEYRFKAQTQLLKTPHFVRQQYFQEIKANPNFKTQTDFQVDIEYLVNLRKSCEQSTRLHKKYQYQAYQYRPGQYRDYYLQQARNVDMGSCRKIDKLYEKHPDYVSQLYQAR